MTGRTLLAILLVYCVVGVQAAEKKKEDVLDQFALIGAGGSMGSVVREPTFSPRPPITTTTLESATSDPSLKLPPRDRMDTEKEFRAGLARLREQVKPFMRNLTPAMPTQRPRFGLETFDFRLETPEDLADAARPWGGDGAWEHARIPEMRGPLGTWAGYYRAHFTLPTGFATNDKRVMLHFEGADYIARVWLNGVYLGEHTGLFAPFEFDATSQLKPGGNTLLVRIQNETIMFAGNGGGRKIDGAGGPLYLHPAGFTPGAGLWRPVWLEARPDLHVTQVFVRPNLERSEAEVWVEIQSLKSKLDYADVRLDFFPRNFEGPAFTDIKVDLKETTRCLVLPGLNTLKMPVAMKGLRQWTPETPWLYTARARLIDEKGRTFDTGENTFGWRTFAFDENSTPKGWPTLNGQRVLLRGANQMGNFEREMMKGNMDQVLEDLLIYKLANCNFMRFTQRPAASEIYDLADQVGLMIQPDLPLFAQVRSDLASEAVKQAAEMERHTRTHPSAVCVSLINEPKSDEALRKDGAWLTSLNRDQLNLLLEQCELAMRIENPDRAVKWIEGVNPAGYIQQGDVPRGVQDVHYYNTWYGPHSGTNLVGLMSGSMYWPKEGWVMTCGEFGAEGLDDWKTIRDAWPKNAQPEGLDKPWDLASFPYTMQTRGLHVMWFESQRTPREWIETSQNYQAWATRVMIDSMRLRPDIMVSNAIHLMVDAYPAGWMKAIVTCTRTPKKSYYEYADAQTPLAAHIYMPRTRYFAGDPLLAEFWVFNDLPDSPQGVRLAWQVLDGESVLFQSSAPAKVNPVSAIYQGSFPWVTPAVKERKALKLRLALLSAGGEVLHDFIQPFDVFTRARPVSPALKICQIGGLLTEEVMREMGFENGPLADASVIVVSDAKAFASQKKAVLERVRGGTGLVLFSAGETSDMTPWDLGELKIARRHTAYPTVFVARNTGHPVVEPFGPDDFRNWYYPAKGRVDYISPGAGYEQNGTGRSILTSGWWDGSKLDIAAEYKLGQGKVAASALCLGDGVLETNPLAQSFTQRLILDAAER